LAAENPSSLMLKLVEGDLDRLTPQTVCDAARQGDPAAKEVFQRAGHALGIGLTNLADIVSPKLIVLGGGIAQAGDLLLEPARAVVRQRAFPPPIRRVQIVPAELGDLSGIYGAAAMVFYDLRVNLDEEMDRP
jgi:glucokinase